jgi:hypothetical protein
MMDILTIIGAQRCSSVIDCRRDIPVQRATSKIEMIASEL